MEKAKLIESHLYLSKVIARHYKSNTMAYEDLVQEGYIGLIKAADRFDPDRGVKFSTYATYWVKQAILESLTSKSRLIRLPSNVVSLKLKINKFIDTFLLSMGYIPDNKLIAKELKESVSKIDQVTKLTTEYTGDWEVAEENNIVEILEISNDYDHLLDVIKSLTPKEKLLLILKFNLNSKV